MLPSWLDRRRTAHVLLTLSLFVAACASSAGGAFTREQALDLSHSAIGRQLSNHRFENRFGETVELAALRGRPLVISLIFTSCYHTCPVITQRLAEAAAMARSALGGRRFTVLTIGFDPDNDTPERMRAYARERQIDESDWMFLSATQPTIDHLTDELGFVFYPSPRGFDHLAQISVLDEEGRVYRQIYGDDFSPSMLVEPLRELVLGLVARTPGLGSWLERVRLFCTVYDPSSGRYRLDYSIVLGVVIGLLCLGGVAVFVVRAWRQTGCAPRQKIDTRDTLQ